MKNALKIINNVIYYFNKAEKEVIIIDTTGRHKEEGGLMEEMKELTKKIKPDHTLLVIDSTIGQQSEAQSKAFTEVSSIGGIIITKLDGAAKGGGAIAAVTNTNANILYQRDPN